MVDGRRLVVAGTLALGALLLLAGLTLGAALLSLWPAIEAATATEPRATQWSFLGLGSWTLTPDAALLLMVIVVGGLGSVVHGATSFTTYVGNRRLELSWGWWYVLRLPTGATLAVLVYFALRAGILTGDATSADINPYGIALIAGLSGLFSKQSVDKLREVFDTILRSRPGVGDDERADKLSSPRPALERADPKRVRVGDSGIQLVLTGQGFTPNTRASARYLAFSGADAGEARDLELQEATADTLRPVLPDALTAAPGMIEITAINPSPGGGRSNPLTLALITPPETDDSDDTGSSGTEGADLRPNRVTQ